MNAAAPLRLGPHERLIVALDEPSGAAALAWVERLGEAVSFYKIGMELLASGEYFGVLDALAARGKKVFVDLKFFDIPATVAGVVRGLSRWPVSFATVHGWHPAMMEAAAAARGGELRLLAVTVLTSMDGADLRAMGIATADPLAVVVQRARAAQAAGIDGVVCSAQEAALVRAATAAPFAIVCPGIRPDGGGGDDQKRVAGVAAAFAAGADCIVVGRPIRQAPDPRAAAEAIQRQIEQVISNQ
ncbi:MAG: orotidine-5'-phosphate decarboxylase [Pseudoxanthomonas sp.]